jgi:hypothetical protein
VLKRRRATPAPAAVIIAGRALTALIVAIAVTACSSILLRPPKVTFPFVITGVARGAAGVRLYRCPECGAKVS